MKIRDEDHAAELLAKLVNYARAARGLGPANPERIAVAARGPVDYFGPVSIKCYGFGTGELTDDDRRLYDRDNGDGAFDRALGGGEVEPVDSPLDALLDAAFPAPLEPLADRLRGKIHDIVGGSESGARVIECEGGFEFRESPDCEDWPAFEKVAVPRIVWHVVELRSGDVAVGLTRGETSASITVSAASGDDVAPYVVAQLRSLDADYAPFEDRLEDDR